MSTSFFREYAHLSSPAAAIGRAITAFTINGRGLRNPENLVFYGRLKFLAQAVALMAMWAVSSLAAADTPVVPSPAPPELSKPASSTQGSPYSTNAMSSLDDKHKLAIGDRLSFRIEEDQEDPKALMVTDSGDLEVPYLGRFPAEGKTCKQLGAELKKALERDYYYQATVIIAVDLMARSRGKIYIVGPVRVPGPQEIPSDETLTLSKAIMRAGGFSDVADRRNVKITRRSSTGSAEKQTFVVDVAQIFDKGKVELDITLEPGDLVLVPERLVRF